MKHITRNPQGNVLMLTALLALILFSVTGAAVDFGRFAMIKLRVQQAIDAAAIAIATLPNNASQAQKTAIFTRYLSLNYSSPDNPALTYLGVTIDPADFQVNYNSPISVTTLPGAIQVPSLFVKMLPNSLSNFDVEAHNQINNITQTSQAIYDVIFVLDNSGSMASPDVGTVDTRDSGTPGTAFAAALADCQTNYATWTCPLNENAGFTPASSNPYYVGILGNSRINALRYATYTLVSNLLAYNAQSQVGATTWSNRLLGSFGLSSNLGAVTTFLDGMYAFDGTNSTLGMQQAQQLAANFDPTHVHAIIYLTDGENTQAGTINPITGLDVYGCNGNTLCVAANNQTLPICQSFKDSGTLVYTIAFGQDVQSNSVVQQYLSSCASNVAGTPIVSGYTPQTTLPNDGTYFFVAPDADSLTAAFNGILTSIKTIKLSQ